MNSKRLWLDLEMASQTVLVAFIFKPTCSRAVIYLPGSNLNSVWLHGVQVFLMHGYHRRLTQEGS